MFNFFVDETKRQGDLFYIDGTDFNHIKNVLRMRVGDELLVSSLGKSHLCEIESLDADTATVKITQENYQSTELPVEIILYQGLPKADKLELIIQKTVELGVTKIVPVEMSRCVVKLDDKKKNAKVSRWQAIAESAAKQSKRTVIPEIGNVLSYKQMLEEAEKLDLFLVPYENKDGMAATKASLSKIKGGIKIGILIGPEGGFEETEVRAAIAAGGEAISLGSRILRTETAAITATAMCMLHIEMSEKE